MSELLNQKTEPLSKIFYFLPSNTDKKKEIKQYLSNVSLNPIDCSYDDFQMLSSSESPFIQSNLWKTKGH